MRSHLRRVVLAGLVGLALVAGLAGGAAAATWSMSLIPAGPVIANSGDTIHFDLKIDALSALDVTFDIFGVGVTFDLAGDVIGGGLCNPGEDCFVQNFLSINDSETVPGNTSQTFDFGDLTLGTHAAGDQVTLIVKGGPEQAATGALHDPAFAEAQALVEVPGGQAPVPPAALLVVTGLAATYVVRRRTRT